MQNTTTMKQYIFIPYVHAPAQWDELRYALRSWEQFADFNYQAVIVGDLPEWCQNVIHIPHTPHYDGKEGELTRDAIEKMSLFLYWAKQRQIKSFIRTYDDIFLLNSCGMKEIGIPKAVEDLCLIMPNRYNTWRKQLWNTYSAVRSNNAHGWNMESHTPEAFGVEFMIRTMDFYQVPPNLYLTSSLYYNSLFTDTTFQPHMLSKSDKYKAGFYGTVNKDSYGPNENVREICEKKLFLNFDPAGFSDAIRDYLIEKFPNPSRHEK